MTETNDTSEPVYVATFAPDDPALQAELSACSPHGITRTLGDGRVALFVDEAGDQPEDVR